MLICKRLGQRKGTGLKRTCLCDRGSPVFAPLSSGFSRGSEDGSWGSGPLCFPSWRRTVSGTSQESPASFLHPAPQPSQWHQPRPLQAGHPGLGDAGESRLRLRGAQGRVLARTRGPLRPHRDHNHREEPHGGGEHRHRETRHRSRDPDREQDHNECNKQRSRHKSKDRYCDKDGEGASRRRNEAADWNRDAYIRQWLSCPFVLLFFFLSLVYPPPTHIDLGGKGVYTAIMWFVLYILYCCCLESNSMK